MTLKRWRLLVALAALLLFASSFFHDNSDARARLLSWQLTPGLLLLAGAALFLILTFLSTALFGRVYCSVWCPAGILQELAFRLGNRLGLAAPRFRPAARSKTLLAASAILLLAGLTAIPNLLDPLGWFGRLVAPLAETSVSVRFGMDNYLGYLGWAGLGMALAAVLLLVVPLFKGRWFCDRLCPAGAALGVVASLSPRKIRIDDDCASCRRCEKVCPVNCLDSARKQVDDSRCVLCFSCLDACRFNAVSYGAHFSPARRTAIAGGASWLAALAYLASRAWKGGVSAAVWARSAVLPPGAVDADAYYRACVGCQSCAAACPVGIIKPQLPGMQPELRFDAGYCQYNCARCTQACPSGALRPLDQESKKVTRIAETELHLFRCVVITEGTACGACAEVCPTRALSMEHGDDPEAPTIPEFYPDHCIGCGACLHVCPATPRAFTVTGLRKHEVSLPMRNAHGEDDGEAPREDSSLTDFPF